MESPKTVEKNKYLDSRKNAITQFIEITVLYTVHNILAKSLKK